MSDNTVPVVIIANGTQAGDNAPVHLSCGIWLDAHLAGIQIVRRDSAELGDKISQADDIARANQLGNRLVSESNRADTEREQRIATELDAANRCATLENELRHLRTRESAHTDECAQARRRGLEIQEEWLTRSRRMAMATLRLARTYGLEDALREDLFTYADDDELISADLVPGVLTNCLERMAGMDHPSVTYPVSGDAVMDVAEQAAREEMARTGATVRDAVRAALRAAAGHRKATDPASRGVGR